MTAEIGSDVVERRGAEDGEDEQDLLGGVGDRRDRVGGQNRERGLLVQPLVLETIARERAAEQELLETTIRRGHAGRRRWSTRRSV